MITTLTKPELEAKVEGLGEVYRADISFDQALESLREFGIQNPISSRDLVYARIKEGRGSSLCNSGSYCREGFLSLKNEPVLLALYSPLLDLELVRQAVEANKNGKYFSTDKRIYEQHREIAENDKHKEPEERTVLILPKRENYTIPTKRFNEYEEPRFLFRDQTEDYGNLLGENNDEMPVLLVDKRYVDSQEGSILTQLWLRGLDYRSDLFGDYRVLGYDGRVRGVFEKTDEVGRAEEN